MLTKDQITTIYMSGQEKVIELVSTLCKTIEHLQSENVSLKARIKEIENQLAANSRNSSKPPSSDGFARQTRSLRQPSGKKSGGQTGHEGTTLKQVDNPDKQLIHYPKECSHCGFVLDNIIGYLDTERRQVFNLPPLKLVVTEHRVSIKNCSSCGRENMGIFPEEVPYGASYGADIKGLLTYFNQEHLIPYNRSCQIFTDLFGQPISEGTLDKAVNTCAKELTEIEAQIKQSIINSKVVNFDETGIYVDKKRGWLHTASTPKLTHYAYHDKRGEEAMKEIGILSEFKGRAIHDGFISYSKYECGHGLCNAHHLRELIFAHEEMGRGWSLDMKQLLLKIKDAVDTAKEQDIEQLTIEQLTEYEQRYKGILETGFVEEEQHPPPVSGKRGQKKQNKSKNLLDRLGEHEEATLVFMKDFAVPFDNNLAERDLRMMKVKQKISGCFRTVDGAKAFCRIRGYISTMRKQGHNIITALSSVFLGNPIIPDVTS